MLETGHRVAVALGDRFSCDYAIGTIRKVDGDAFLVELDVAVDEHTHVVVTESEVAPSEVGRPTKEEREDQESRMNSPKTTETTLVGMLNEYHDMMAVIDEKKEELKKLQEQADEKLAACKERMDAEQLKNCKFERPDGTTLMCLRQRVYAPKVTDKDAFREWCAGFGVQWEALHMFSAGKFKKFVRDLEKDGLPIPAGVEAYETEKLQFRRS